MASRPFRGPATCAVQGAPVCRVGCCGIACSGLGRSLSAHDHTAFDHAGAAPAARAAGGGRRAARGLCDGRTDLARQRGQGAAARPHPRPPVPSRWRSRRTSARTLLTSIRAAREQVSDRAIEGSGEAGVSLKVLYLDQNLHMLQPLWDGADGAAPPIVLSRVEA